MAQPLCKACSTFRPLLGAAPDLGHVLAAGPGALPPLSSRQRSQFCTIFAVEPVQHAGKECGCTAASTDA